MVNFSHISLLQLAVDVIAVRTVAAVEIVLNAERGWSFCRHRFREIL